MNRIDADSDDIKFCEAILYMFSGLFIIAVFRACCRLREASMVVRADRKAYGTAQIKITVLVIK